MRTGQKNTNSATDATTNPTATGRNGREREPATRMVARSRTTYVAARTRNGEMGVA